MGEKMVGARQYRLISQSHGVGNITEICGVVSSGENTVAPDTGMELLAIKGEELHVSRLTLEKGEVGMEGTINSVIYSSNEALRESGGSLFTRLFK